MSVWTPVARAETPLLFHIRESSDGTVSVLAPDGGVLHSADSYRAAHLWAANTHHLTSTAMLPYYEDYRVAWEASHPPEEPPAPAPVELPAAQNKYRRPGK